MHWKRFCLVSLSLAWMAFPDRVRAQEISPNPGYAAVDDLSGAMTLSSGGGSYLLFNKQTGQAVGIPNGYSRIGIRHAIFEEGPSQVFGEAHALITDTNRFGFNGGLGYRMMMDDALWGINGWYDTIESPQAYNYQQAGVGIEYLSDSLDLRANGYIPIGNRENFLRVTDPGTTPIFVGHDFATLGTALFQQSLAGFDAEAGVPLPVVHWLRAYAGFYHLSFEDDETWGVRSRIEGRLARGVNLSFQVTNDDKFGTNLNIGVDVRFDGRLPTRFGDDDHVYTRRYDQVRRQWQVQLANNKGDYAVPLNDRITGERIVVTWVNNTSAAGGDGTFEHPFQNLPSGANSDYVLVRRGVGDTVGNITLRDGQDLFGEGKQHSIDTDRLGMTPIPESYFANTGAYPTLRAADPTAPIVTLADNNIVRAFNMIGGTNAAILGSGTDNFLIECVNATSASGISIHNAGGVGAIRDSNFINTSPTGTGIAITNTTGTTLGLEISDVTTQGGAVGTSVRASGAPVNLTMSDVTGTAHTNAGVILGASGPNGVMTANVDDVTLTNVGDGFRFDVASGGSLSGSVTNISATGSGNLLEGNANAGTLNLQVTGANLSGSTAGSGVAFNINNSVGRATFDNLTADGNAVDGVQLTATGPSTNYELEVHDSSLVGNADDAVDTTVLGGATVVTLVDPTPATGSGNNGYEFEVNGAGSNLTATVEDTDLSNAGNDGVSGRVTDGGRAVVIFDNSPASGSGRNGLDLVVDNNSSLTGTFRGGSFANSGVGNNGVGINVSSTNDSNVALTFDGTPSNGNGAVGLSYQVVDNSTLSATFTNGNLSDNPVNNIVGTVDGAGSQATLVFNNTDASNQAVNGGFVANVTNGGLLNATFTDSDVSNTLGDGVRVAGTGSATQIGLTFNNSLIDGNAGNGVVASLTGGNDVSQLALTLNDSSVTGNAGDGVHVTLDGLGTLGAVDINSTPIANNGLDGFEYDVTGGARFAATVTGTGNDFSNNGENGIDGFVSGAPSLANVFIEDANVDSSGQTGVLLESHQQGRHRFNLTNSTILGSGGHGVEANASTSGQLTVNLTDVNIQQSQGNGYKFDATSGGDITGTVLRGFIRNNGLGAPASGVLGTVTGNGSTANVTFDGTQITRNSLHGVELDASSRGQLTARLQNGVLANNNLGDGIRLTATGSGTQGNLLMTGANDASGNGGDGLNVTGTNAEQVAVQFVGGANINGGDGIHVSLNNVNRAAIEIASVNSGTVDGNGGDGIELSLVDTDLIDLTVDGTLVESLDLSGLTIQNNGGLGLNINADNSDLGSGSISNNTIRDNAGGGIALNLTNGSDWNLGITGNSILDNGGSGIQVSIDSGVQALNISDNTVAGSLVDNINVDLNGTSETQLNIDRNIVDGDGIAPSITPIIVRSFLSPIDSVFTSGEPPDAMGAVGTNHLIELVNDNYRVYDKDTGALLVTMSDENFWRSVAGANLFGSDVFDHRILFDPSTNRWIASAITRGGGNQILLAVSNTDDPTAGWQSVQWRGDPAGVNFNDFDTLGFDADSVVISTNDFGTGITVSVFTIPKADLFNFGTPSIARMTRFQNLNPANVGTALQAAVDHGPSDGRTAILAVNDLLAGSNQILRTDVLGGTGSAATLSTTTAIAVPNFNSPLNTALPGGSVIRTDSDRFWANTVEVNDELWAVHHVQSGGATNEIRWYRINEATNTVIATGSINVPGLSLFMPSIAVNNAGEVIISYHAANGTTAPSAYASAGIVQGNNVTFGTPTLLTAGTGEYGGGRWGDYSATVVDPTDSSRFWSILEVGRGVTDGFTDFEYGEAFNALEVNVVPGSVQTTAGNGIRVVARDNAVILAGSSFNENTVTGHGGDGITLDLSDNSELQDFTIDGNIVTNNGGDGIRVTTTGGQTIGNLSVSQNTNVSGNGGDGIQVILNNLVGNPELTVNNNSVTSNGGLGIAIDAIDTSVGPISVQNNISNNNTGGDGLRVDLTSTTGAHTADEIRIANNTVSGNSGRGIHINDVNMSLSDVIVSQNIVNGNLGGPGVSILLENTTGGLVTADQLLVTNNSITGNAGRGLNILLDNISTVSEVTVSETTITGNTGAGYVLTANNSPIGAVTVDQSNISENTGGDGVLFDLTNSAVNDLTVSNSGINNNRDRGLNFDLDNSPIQNLRILDNLQGTGVNIGLSFLMDGSTFPIGTGAGAWSITNSSDPGVDITSFVFDTTPTGRIYNTVSGANFPFTVFNNTDVLTGLQTVNGTAVPPYPNNLVADFSSLLDLSFGDFNSGETFAWDIDADETPGGDESVLGDELIGSTITVNFTGGLFLSGTMQAVAGNPDASTFIATAGNNFAGGISGNGLDGIRFNATNGSNIGHMEIDRNRVDGNGGHGIDFLVQDSTLPDITDHISITDNVITDQTGTGIRMVLPDTNGTSFGVDFVNNTITDNVGGPGVDIQLDDNAGTNFETTFTDNRINENGGHGVNVDLSQNIVADITNFSGNTVNDNTGMGMRIDATDNTQFTLNMGGTGHNSFSGNRDAGLGITMNGNTQAQVAIVDSQFDNTVNGADANFNGEGVAIRMQDNAILPNLLIGDPALGTSTASGNASHGIQVFVDGFSQLTNPTIQSMTINGNGGDGINIERRGIGVIDNFVISSNNLNQNAGDGMDIQARAANLTDEYTITDNTINGSGGRGIAFRVDGDADMTSDLNGNSVTNSVGTGISVESTINAITDTPTFTGTWLASTITGNGGHGIDINSPGHVIQIGDATAAFPDTTISNNGGNGVLVRSTGTLDLDNVRINDNGANGVLFQGGTGGLLTIDRAELAGNAGHGADLEMTGNTISVTASRIAENDLDGVRVRSAAGVNNVTLNNNIVTLNGQDGLELVNNSAAGLTATITNSQFNSNAERGAAIFNRGNGQANVTFDDNQAVSNGEEGVYVVNTASVDQDTRANATAALSSNGLVTANPDLIFEMNRNTVSANGLGSAFSATGLVMRVGTADGGLADFTNNGGFAATRAGVTATVRDNILQGNAGSDVFFESFVSTGNPLTSVGTWDAGTFALVTYQTDPLARLDLIYGNNVADSTQATNIGASYNNDEGVFKSRLSSQTPAGPFASAVRDRNAQRLADRDVAPGGVILAPTVPTVQPDYLYSGVGESTFRVRLEPGNIFGTGTGFMLDNAPFTDVNDYNGVGTLNELFGWGTLP